MSSAHFHFVSGGRWKVAAMEEEEEKVLLGIKFFVLIRIIQECWR